jgi:ribosomal protein L37AE/L43A
MKRERFQPGPCPSCGRASSATMSSASWGHMYQCCGEQCGRKFAGSDARLRLDLQRAIRDVVKANEEVERLALELSRRSAGYEP